MATDAPEPDAASDNGPGSPNYNPDFETMGIDDPAVVATLETVWTLLLRGYESPKFPEITERTLLPLLYDVYLHPEGGPLTGEEAQDLEIWIDALGDAREPARGFTDLTCIEYSALSVLARALERGGMAEAAVESESEVDD